MEIDVQERGALRKPVDHVGFPHLVEQGAGRLRHGVARAASFDGAFPRGGRALPSSVHGIMARSRAPTRSIGGSAAPRRYSANLRAPPRVSAIHSRANAPLWISFSSCCISAFTWSFTMRGPRV